MLGPSMFYRSLPSRYHDLRKLWPRIVEWIDFPLGVFYQCLYLHYCSNSNLPVLLNRQTDL